MRNDFIQRILKFNADVKLNEAIVQSVQFGAGLEMRGYKISHVSGPFYTEDHKEFMFVFDLQPQKDGEASE